MRFAKVYVELTNACGQACSFCPSRPKQKRVMSLESFGHVLLELKPYTKTLALHVFGDPLMLENIKEYMDLAHASGFGIHLVTSGFRLSMHKKTLLSHPALIQLNISLNSALGQCEEKLRTYLEEIMTWCEYKRHHAPRPFVNLRLWNKGGDARDADFSLAIETFFSHTFFHTPMLEWNVEKKVCQLDTKIRLHKEQYFMWPSLSAPVVPDGFCHGLHSHIGVLSDGTVVPCCLDGEGVLMLGNLFIQPLYGILASQKAQEIRRGFDEKKPPEPLCQRCDFRKRFL
ncbi:radical SAM/SPASM domain-containing protein [Sulfurospirillum sp. T05]|uniref:Radical SAM/SPASM domain-containing protein n=1 Tax=Sulfurospirillum tamanense TaxID=2813362 RepID=A0ABS2WQS0_9BACT|nr:radical SAM/SPASM domain-containing protein [Sulfurospirillum tamanensis]MBN2964032.1 radical SAM/SPASM domain-containing protein [Sulfurospirillum tamanensis]